MAHPNIVMRDPVIYRIVKAEHHNTGNEWVIYPMYDYAHPIEDAIERITHSIIVHWSSKFIAHYMIGY